MTRVFPMPAGPVVAVRDVALRVGAGDHVAICGPSGCGKSTLLHLLGCVDAPSEGTLLVEDRDVTTLGDRERSQIRLTRIGFLFLANRPRLLLADEPTGELDRSTGEQVAALLDRVNADGTALVIVTHDVALARRAHRILTMRDGAIVSEEPS